MLNLLRKSIVVSGLAALGIIVGASASHAGEATLNLTGDVGVECNFSQANYSNPTATVGSSGAFNASLTWNGEVGVSCNHGGEVVITTAAPIVNQTVADARALITYVGEYLSINETKIWENTTATSNTLTSATLTPTTNIPYKVVLETNPGTDGPGLGSGRYTYSFTLTAVPN